MEDRRENILISSEKISEKISEIGELISKEYKDRNLYILSLLRGSFIFTADLVRKINIPVKIGFMSASSYGNDETTSGRVKIIQDITDDLKEFDVLIVDDIMDSGITMKYIKEHVKNLGAKSVKSCVLLNKPSRRKAEISPDYVCFTIPDVFVVGYGLNYGDYYRNKPYVFNWEVK